MERPGNTGCPSSNDWCNYDYTPSNSAATPKNMWYVLCSCLLFVVLPLLNHIYPSHFYFTFLFLFQRQGKIAGSQNYEFGDTRTEPDRSACSLVIDGNIQPGAHASLSKISGEGVGYRHEGFDIYLALPRRYTTAAQVNAALVIELVCRSDVVKSDDTGTDTACKTVAGKGYSGLMTSNFRERSLQIGVFNYDIEEGTVAAHSADCRWTVRTAATLFVEYLDTENDPTCGKDYLEIERDERALQQAGAYGAIPHGVEFNPRYLVNGKRYCGKGEPTEASSPQKVQVSPGDKIHWHTSVSPGKGFLMWVVEDISEGMLAAFGEGVQPWNADQIANAEGGQQAGGINLVGAGLHMVPKFDRATKPGRCIDDTGTGRNYHKATFFNDGHTTGLVDNPRIPRGAAGASEHCQKVCTSLGENCQGFSFKAVPQQCELIFSRSGEFQVRSYPERASPQGFLLTATTTAGDDQRTIHKTATDNNGGGRGWSCFHKTMVGREDFEEDQWEKYQPAHYATTGSTSDDKEPMVVFATGNRGANNPMIIEGPNDPKMVFEGQECVADNSLVRGNSNTMYNVGKGSSDDVEDCSDKCERYALEHPLGSEHFQKQCQYFGMSNTEAGTECIWEKTSCSTTIVNTALDVYENRPSMVVPDPELINDEDFLPACPTYLAAMSQSYNARLLAAERNRGSVSRNGGSVTVTTAACHKLAATRKAHCIGQPNNCVRASLSSCSQVEIAVMKNERLHRLRGAKAMADVYNEKLAMGMLTVCNERDGYCVDPSCYYAMVNVGSNKKLPNALALEAHRYGYGCIPSENAWCMTKLQKYLGSIAAEIRVFLDVAYVYFCSPFSKCYKCTVVLTFFLLFFTVFPPAGCTYKLKSTRWLN